MSKKEGALSVHRLKRFLIFAFLIYGVICVAFAFNHNTPRERAETDHEESNKLIDIPLAQVPLIEEENKLEIKEEQSFDLPLLKTALINYEENKALAKAKVVKDQAKQAIEEKEAKLDTFPELGALEKPNSKEGVWQELDKAPEKTKLNENLIIANKINTPAPKEHGKNNLEKTVANDQEIQTNSQNTNLEKIPFIAPLSGFYAPEAPKKINKPSPESKAKEKINIVEEISSGSQELTLFAENLASSLADVFSGAKAEAYMGQDDNNNELPEEKEDFYLDLPLPDAVALEKKTKNTDTLPLVETNMPLPDNIAPIKNVALSQENFDHLDSLSLPAPGIILSNTDKVPPSSTLRAQNSKAKNGQELKLENIKEEGNTFFRLTNGMGVLLRKDERFPLVSLRLYVHAGSSYENPRQAGISHVLEHMVFKGTKKYPKGQIASTIESSGGYLNAATSFDYTVYLTDMTSDQWQKGLDVLKEMTFYPSLEASELEAEKKVVLAELERGKDEPSSELFDMMIAHSLKGTPYERPIIGYPFTITSFTPADIREYIDQWYQPQSMLLVINGNIDVDEASKLAVKTFSDLENTHPVMEPERPLTTPRANPTAEVQKGPWQKVHLAISFPTAHLKDLKSNELDVLRQLLGGDTTSYLYRKYRYDLRLVDSIGMGTYGFEKAGLTFVRVSLDADKVAKFWAEFTKDMAGLKDLKFTDEELERAKLNINDRLFRAQETLGGYTSKLGNFYFFLGGEDAEENYLRSIENVTLENLSQLAQEFFQPENASIVALVPEGTTAGNLGFKSAQEDLGSIFLSALHNNWKGQSVEAQSETAIATGEMEEIDLGDNRKLILIPDSTLPYASGTLTFEGGNSALMDSEQGLGAFTASLLTKGAGDMSANDIQDFLSNRASSLGASSGLQSFSISFDAPARFLSDIFGLLKTTLDKASFDKEEADRVRETQIAAIVRSEDSALSLAFRRMFSSIFKDHSYGYLQLGEVASVEKFTEEDAKKFWEKQRNNGWVLTLCGTFNKDQILEEVKSLPLPKEKTAELTAPEWSGEKEISYTLEGRNQSHLMLVFPTAPAGSEDEAGLDLLNNILAGQSGLLFRDLRDKQGLGYTVTSLPWKSKNAGILIFYIGTEPDKTQTAMNGFTRVVGDLHKKALPKEELDRGKSQMQGDYYRGRQSRAARSREAASLSILGLPLDNGQQVVDKALKLTPKDIQKLVQKYLKLDNAYIVRVDP